MTNIEFNEFLETVELTYIWTGVKVKSKGFFEVPDSWLGIIKELIVELLADGWDGTFYQCKEKWGGLRLYTNYSDPNKIIEKYIKLIEEYEESNSRLL